MFRRCLIPFLAVFSFFSCGFLFAQDSIDTKKKISEIRKRMAKKIDDKNFKDIRKKVDMELDILREQLIEEMEQELTKLEKDITLKPGFWGLSIYPINPGLKILLQVPKDKDGFVVLETQLNSPAQSSGIEPLDVITQLDNFNLKGIQSEIDTVFQKFAGKQDVEVETLRNGRQRVLQLKLSEKQEDSSDLVIPESQIAVEQIQNLLSNVSLPLPSTQKQPLSRSSDDEIVSWYKEWQKSKTFVDLDPIAFLGVAVQDFTHRERKELKIPAHLGVRIVEILPNSPAETSNKLKASDIIWKINQKDIKSPKHFQQMIHKRSPGDKISMLIVASDGSRKVIYITLGVRKANTE